MPNTNPCGLTKRTVAIIGTNGLPGRYGGWDQLLNNLTIRLKERFSFSVYTSAYNAKRGLRFFNEARLRVVPLKANGAQSVFYDIVSMIDALFRREQVMLILGTSGCLFLPIVKILYGGKVILNPDGAEWKRGKWGTIAKGFLYLSEIIGVKFADIVVADNKVIRDFINSEYKIQAELIEYGGDNARKVPLSIETAEKFKIQAREYAFKVCRIEPENNLDMILEAFSKTSITLLIVGNWDFSNYGKRLRQRYKSCKNLLLLDPIYGQRQLDELRGNCGLYIHGHSVGGTNPSLVEAMNLGLCCVAFKVDYNIETTENSAVFFSTADDLLRILGTFQNGFLNTTEVGEKLLAIAKRRYSWSRIISKYSGLLS